MEWRFSSVTNIIEEFDKYYYNSLVWAHDTKWLDTPIAKLPL